jgi:hypothetical protein
MGAASVDAPADWTAAADELIGAGVTRIERDKVAAVLAELAGGTAPSTVARKVGVGYRTVARIAEYQVIARHQARAGDRLRLPRIVRFFQRDHFGL